MQSTTKFEYADQPIVFQLGQEANLINATQMAAAFPGKRVNTFLRSKSTQDFIRALEGRYANLRIDPSTKVLQVIKGGHADQQGTWMHELLAIKFAGYLSPEFEVWMYERIRELLMTGRSSVPGREVADQDVVRGLRAIINRLEQQDGRIDEVQDELAYAGDRLTELEAQVTSVDKNYYTVAGYCKLEKVGCPLHLAQQWGKAALALSKQEGIPTGAAHDERFGKVRTYHREVLSRVVNQ